MLARAGRVNLRRPVRAFFDDLFSNPAFQPHALTPEQIYTADDVRFTRDPFDGLIVAAAHELGLPLLSHDAEIRGARIVRIIW